MIGLIKANGTQNNFGQSERQHAGSDDELIGRIEISGERLKTLHSGKLPNARKRDVKLLI